MYIFTCTKTHTHTHTHCEGPDCHPTLFWEVATGLSGVVGKEGAGDGGLYTKNIFLFISLGILSDQPRNRSIQ